MRNLWMCLAGVLGGVVGGMGMGGGTLLIPLLTAALDVEQKAAQLINLTAFLPMSAIALWIHAKKHNVSWGAAMRVGIPAVIGAATGAWLASVMHAQWLARAFGIFLVALGVWTAGGQLVVDIRNRKKKRHPNSDPADTSKH